VIQKRVNVLPVSTPYTKNALRERNVMDFNGIDTRRLPPCAWFPAVAARIRQSYPYWLIDEFQDTTPAQYGLYGFLAGNEFKNVFVVADDDQIIYQWAGASYRQIVDFREQFSPKANTACREPSLSSRSRSGR